MRVKQRIAVARALLGPGLLLALAALPIPIGVQAQEAQAAAKVWAEDPNPDSLDIETVRRDFSLWGLLSESTVRKDLKESIKAEVAYINPITYVHLVDQESGGTDSPEAMKEKLREVFGAYTLFYVVLKSETNPRLIGPDDWKIAVRNAGKKELLPAKIEAGQPELTYGYTGNFYQTAIYAYFADRGDPSETIDIQAGAAVRLENSKLGIREELGWGGSGQDVQKETYRVYHAVLRIVLPIVAGLLLLVLILTKPGREWKASSRWR